MSALARLRYLDLLQLGLLSKEDQKSLVRGKPMRLTHSGHVNESKFLNTKMRGPLVGSLLILNQADHQLVLSERGALATIDVFVSLLPVLM